MSDAGNTMWAFLMKYGQKANIPSLKSYVNDLIKMTTQKTAGQRRDKTKELSFDDLDIALWGIVIEATALVLSGELEKLDGGGGNE